MRYNRPRRNRFRSNAQDFRKNGSHDLRAAGVKGASSFQRRPFNRNGIKAEKLLEKYNNLAKEALTNGDNILSESYYQHADHFLRVIENKNLTRNNTKPHLESSSSEENSNDKIILKDEQNSSSKQSQNNEEI